MPAILKLGLLAIILPSIIVLVLFYSPVFKLQKIEVSQNQTCINPQNVFAALGNSKNLIFLSQKKLEDTLKSQYSCIRKIEIRKKFPSILEIKIAVKEPVVIIEGTNLLLASDGQVVEGVVTGDKPILFLPSEVKVVKGQKIADPLIIFALQVTAKLLKSDFLPVNVRFIGVEDVAIYNQQGQLAIFTAKKEIDLQVDSLQQVISKAKIESAKIAKIDLRFEKPVVTYK